MLSEDELNAIEFFKECITKEHLFEEDFTLYNMKILVNLITKLQKEIEHQKEKREHQKVELAILNERQKEMNKLKNTVNSYYGMFKKQEKQIKELQKENEEKDKKIDLIIEEFYKKMKISTNCYIQRKRGTEQCLNYRNCKECLKQYFKKLAKEKDIAKM